MSSRMNSRRNPGITLDTEVRCAEVEFIPRIYAKPLHLSSGMITEITEARVRVTVRVKGREATGQGAVYLSDLWAWPEPSLTHKQRDGVLRDLCEEIARDLPSLCGGEAAHPLELGLRLHDAVCSGSPPSVLARAMCASPFDAAIHDGAGIALERSAFDFYDEESPLPSADQLFEKQDACAAIARSIKLPRTRLDAWWIVGSAEDLEAEVAPWVRERGYRCFKLKILGRDNAADVARTVEVYQALRRFGVEAPRLTVDSNEANPDADSVLDYLERLWAEDEEAFEALDYLEQPTGRDILVHKQDWRDVTELKPVLLDEGLTGLELLDEAVAQGWSGFALKTCKGHSFVLVAAAWAREHRLVLTVQDLTNPGLAAIHAALFAAHLPMRNGVEINSPQYTPDANVDWLPRLSGLFEPQEGVHCIGHPKAVGLGSKM